MSWNFFVVFASVILVRVWQGANLVKESWRARHLTLHTNYVYAYVHILYLLKQRGGGPIADPVCLYLKNLKFRTIMISRVKGHGKRATYILRPPLVSSWHIKLRPIAERQILLDELARLRWIRHRLPSTKGVAYLPTISVGLLMTQTVSGKPGHELISSIDPKKLISALVNATRMIQNTKLDGMTFDTPEWASDRGFSLSRLEKLSELRKSGKELHPDFKRLSKNQLEQIINQGPDKPVRLVLAHGDLCMPNLLFSNNAELTGVIDLGAMHANDPLLDIALLSWCIRANMGEKWSDLYLSKFDVDNDNPAIQYYRLIYDLSLNFPKPWLWVEKPKLVEQRGRLAKYNDS